MRLTVADLMTQRPVIVSPDCSADSAVEILSRHEATELYVTDKIGRLLGVVPDFELVKAELSGEASGATVEQLMSRNLPVFTPQSDAAEVARLFRDGRYSQFPIVSGGKLIGIITRRDVVRLMAVLRRFDSPVSQPTVRVKTPKLATRSRPKAQVATDTTPKRRGRRPVARISRG
ncbi:MAG: CBS domain-containing protein [Planctomycetes bacterium]|nr:CBS domain-containing protein [Planctomycetota bacterium]